MRGLVVRKVALALAGVSLAGLATPLAAQAQTQSARRTFNIPPQEMANALEAFGRQSGRDILFDRRQVAGMRSSEVTGTFEPGDALRRLVAGSSLSVRTPNASTFVVGAGPGEATAGGAAADNIGANAQEIVVTGTNIRGAQPVGTSLVVVDRREIERGGYTNAQDIVRSQTQSFSGGPGVISPAGGIGPGLSESNSNVLVAGLTKGASLNLRGQGAGSTLVLLNSRRLAPGGQTGLFVDVSAIPVSAIERVEILPDGASALYGSDAVGGVVNYILRTDYEGVETRAQAGIVPDGDAENYLAALTAGTSWSTGHVMLTYQYRHQDELPFAARAFSASADQRPFGGSDFRTQRFGLPGTILSGGITYAIPDNQNGTALTRSQFTAGTTNALNSNQNNNLITQFEDHTLFAYAEQELAGWLQVSLEGFYNRRTSENRRNSILATGSVTSASPFYINPNPNNGTSQVTVSYDLGQDLDAFGRQTTEAARLNFGLIADVGRSWRLRGDLTYAFSKQDAEFVSIDQAAFTAALNLTDRNTAFNPFGDGSYIQNPATVASFRRVNPNVSDFRIRTARLVADGSLLRLPGGPVRVAIGAEYRRETQESIGGVAPTDYQRDTEAVFGEVSLPIVSSGMNVPGIHSLTASAAARYEHYSDFGNSFVPRLGLEWEVVEGFRLRSSWGRSFRAPDFVELDTTRNAVALSTAPSGRQVLRLAGGNPDLRPEKATTFNFGVDLAPPPLSGFRASATYFEIRYKDRIDSGLAGFANLDVIFTDPSFAPFVIDNATPEQRAAACANGILQSVPNCANLTFTRIADGRLTNLTAVTTKGIDGSIAYGWSSRLGEFSGRLSATYLFAYDQQTRPGINQVSFLNRQFNPVDFRLRATFQWTKDELSAGGAVNYVDDYAFLGTTGQPTGTVDSFLTVDLNLRYAFGSESGILRDTAISLAVTNLFDRAPPYLNVIQGFDQSNADPIGRRLLLTLNRRW